MPNKTQENHKSNDSPDESGRIQDEPMPHTRRQAQALLEEWTDSPSLIKHGQAVAFCTEAYGVRHAEALHLDPQAASAMAETYACAGLLHDFDYDRHPAEHPYTGVAYLREHGWPEEILHAILAHADYTGAPRESHLDKALFASDELAGFLTACALVKPTKSILDVEVPGVRKKMKDKAFARGVLREDIHTGAALLGIPVDEHIAFCLAAMQSRAGDLGLRGTPPTA